MEFYRRAAATGHAGAQNNLGLLYDEGLGVPRDPAKAHKLYLSAAASNYAAAQFNVGINYATGTTVPQSWAEAAVWYQKAADQGELRACNNLGNIYFFGRGVPVNLTLARKYLQPPADAGLAVSQYGLGAILMSEGKPEEAVALFRTSADGGYPGGQFFLAVCLFEGKGVPSDPKAALKWARIAVQTIPVALPDRAVEADTLVAKILLSEPPGIPPSPEEAHTHARRAAEQGDLRGQFLLGLCYQRGVGVKRDLAEAVKWYRMSVSQKYVDAAMNLGVLLESGLGAEVDYPEAAKCYALAAETGNVVALYRLAVMYRYGLGGGINLAKSAELFRRVVAQSTDPAMREQLAQVEKQLAYEPDFRRGLELGQLGEGGAETFREAYEYLRKAADGGHRHAIAITAGMLRRGQGTAPDETAADAMIAKLEPAATRRFCP